MNASFQIKEISSDSACFRESAEIVAREFVKHEPLTVAVQFDEMHNWIFDHCESPIFQKLSFAAIEPVESVVIGATFCEDFRLHEWPSGDDPIDCFLRDMLSASEPLLPTDSAGPGKILYVNLLAVAQEFGGRGIASMLVQRALAEAKERGFKYAFTLATALASQHIFDKLGFKTVKEFAYKEYSSSCPARKGEKVFAALDSPPSCKAMIIRL